MSVLRIAVAHGDSGRDMSGPVFLGNEPATCSHVYPVTRSGQCHGCGEMAPMGRAHATMADYTYSGSTLLGPVTTGQKPDPHIPDFRCSGVLWCAKHERHYDEKNGYGGCR
jgi:hypothetical protein